MSAAHPKRYLGGVTAGLLGGGGILAATGAGADAMPLLYLGVLAALCCLWSLIAGSCAEASCIASIQENRANCAGLALVAYMVPGLVIAASCGLGNDPEDCGTVTLGMVTLGLCSGIGGGACFYASSNENFAASWQHSAGWMLLVMGAGLPVGAVNVRR